MPDQSVTNAAALNGAEWFKSSYSGGGEAQCVEVADVRTSYAAIAIRDSKNPDGPALLLATTAFVALIDDVRSGRFTA